MTGADNDFLLHFLNDNLSWDLIRDIRQHELKNTDWWALKDLTMSQAKKDYRTFLRNMPESYDTPQEALTAWIEYEKPE